MPVRRIESGLTSTTIRTAAATIPRRSRLAARAPLWRPFPVQRPLPKPLSPRAAREIPRLDTRARLDAHQPDHAHDRLLAGLLDSLASRINRALCALRHVRPR